MFNFDAEVYLILYLHGAGGNFLAMLLSTDPDMCGVDGKPQQPNLIERYKQALKSNTHNAHFGANDVDLSDPNFVATAPHCKKYVFAYHPDYAYGVGRTFFQQCKNLKIIAINNSNDFSDAFVNKRRDSFIPPVVPIGIHEKTLIQCMASSCRDLFGTPVQLVLEVEHYWTPKFFVPRFEDYIAINQLKVHSAWKVLYHIWRRQVLLAPINESNRQEKFDRLPPPR